MSIPFFSLIDTSGEGHRFPSGKPALLCFVHEECETCNLSMPLIEAAHQAFGEEVDIWAIGQDEKGNALLIERYGLTAPMLDDSALHVSYAFDLDTVPTIILATGNGDEVRRFIGFGKEDWQALYAKLSALAGAPPPAIDWNSYPASRPGCGSLSVAPGFVEKLEAESSGSPLRARRIEIGESDDVFEFMFDQGLTDGLPVVPPTPERVLRMLTGTKRDAQEVVAIVPPNMAPATVEKIATNAVMAGCKPEYLPVVIAALEAVCTDEFNIHGVMATTWGASPTIVVNGPIRHKLGMNMKLNVLGQGNRANATIGRALKLVLRNLGGARPGEIERSVLGGPNRYTMCFAEWEERSPWEPLHVERGFRPDENVVTVFAMQSPHGIADQTSRTAHALAGAIGLGVEFSWHPKNHDNGDLLLVVCPEHIDTLWRDGWTKDQLRQRIQDVTSRPLRDLIPNDDIGAGMPRRPGLTEADLDRLVPKFQSASNIHIVVAGGEAGKFSQAFAGWQSGPTGSMPVSRRIGE